ncbi:hypothetical protein THAOC_33865 [Thalassiosira oceanica]|uniref:Uncharacterized protein n=1 Tax=Thalassiosira oceanica TaxID=159749 RepID=K0REC7_THAOC|nr:hypothetical protein THAOC_33865 [Thalassiosira oceanica]|eukprot:EJK47416.1 hypothetical protein THAOC_33865 [Thalassiosira oceanica]
MEAAEEEVEVEEEVEEDHYWIYTGEAEVPDDVTHVRVSDDVTVLPARVFSSRARLMAVELNKGLVEVGDRAFYSCSSLECVRMPTSVKTLGEYAFAQCDKLYHVEFPEDSRIGAITIGRGAFANCESLTKIKLPKSLSSLGKSAFQNCKRLTRADLAHTGLVAIEESVFFFCYSLEDVHLPVTVESINDKAFEYCYGLSTIVMHEGIKNINYLAFRGCRNLSIDTLPSTVETIGSGAISGCNLRQFASPLHCKELHVSAILAEKLKSIQIVGDDTRLIGYAERGGGCVEIPSLLRMNIPRSSEPDGKALFLPGRFISNLSITPNSTMAEDVYIKTFGEFNDKGCTLNRMKSRFKQLPLHEICFDYSNQHTEVTFEQVRECLGDNVEALLEKDCIGMTPLHIVACSTNHDIRLFQLLISRCHGALMDRDIFGRTALDYALLSDASEEVFYLLFEPFVKMGELPLNLELIDAAVEDNVPALQTWKVFSDYLERLFPALDLDWEDLFPMKVHQNSNMSIELYRWFARKAVQQRMMKMNTLTSTRLTKINEMIDSFHPLEFCGDVEAEEGEYQLWQRQVGPAWKLMKRWELKEATVLLELALWKCSLEDSSVGIGSRVEARISCGAEIIINEVVQFLSHGDFEAEIFGELFTLEEYNCESEEDGDYFGIVPGQDGDY